MELNLLDNPEFFTDAQILVAMDAMSRNDRTDPETLMELLGTDLDSIQSMLRVMERWGWIRDSKHGVSLSERGSELYSRFGIVMADISSETYVLGEHQHGAVVRSAADKVTNGVEQRDMAVEYGAAGASVFVVRNGRVLFPEILDMDEEDPEFAQAIRSTGAREGDVLIIVGSSSDHISRILAAKIAMSFR